MSFSSVKRKLRRLETDLEDTAVDAVEDSAEDTVFTAKGFVVAQDAVASTELYRGLTVVRNANNVTIHSLAPHSGFVEWGTGPKQAPTAPVNYDAPEYSSGLVYAIYEWMLIKPSFQNSRATIQRAHFIAKELSEEGQKPQPFLTPAWEEHKPLLINHVKREIRRLL